MRFLSIICALTVLFFAVGPNPVADAAVIGTATLDQINGTGTLTDPAEIIDVTIEDADGAVNPDTVFQVTVDGGLAFEEFFFNFDPALTVSDIALTGDSIGQWTIDTNGGQAGSFGSFNFALDGLNQQNPDGLTSLTFEILLAGTFQPNSGGNFFAAKVASQGSSFVAANSISAVPLPAALPLFLTVLAGMGFLRRRRRKALAA